MTGRISEATVKAAGPNRVAYDLRANIATQVMQEDSGFASLFVQEDRDLAARFAQLIGELGERYFLRDLANMGWDGSRCGDCQRPVLNGHQKCRVCTEGDLSKKT